MRGRFPGTTSILLALKQRAGCSRFQEIRVLTVAALFVFVATCAACTPERPALSAAERRFELRGKVVEVDPTDREITIDHEEIADYMDAMTMPFSVHDEADLVDIFPGDRIQATLVVAEGRSWLEGLKVVGSDEQGTVLLPPDPVPGTPVPALALVNQDGAQMRFDRYRGKALLVTFIYTRCPLPDYCILMSNNFKQVEESLRATPALYAKTDLVSVSIDPEHDTPAVLAAYGKSLMPTETRFDHWQFVTGAPDKIREFAAFFGLSYEMDDGQIVHSLRTAVIDPQGNVVEIFKGNEWKPVDAIAALRKAVE